MTNQEIRSQAAADPSAGSGQDVRQKAEALARERAARTPEDSAALSPEEIRNTLHELRVHQIELEMQNEELRAAQAQIEVERERYYDLYDLAPVGYCTLSEQGLILEANLTAATLLGTTRSLLVKQPISSVILKDDQDIYYLHRKKLFETGEPQECELRLVKPDGASFWAHLTATAARGEDGAPVCRMVISDITESKQAGEALRENEELLSRTQKIAHTGSWKLDLTANRLTWSDEVYHIFGCEPQEFAATYEAFLDFVHPDDRAAVDEGYSRSLREGSDGYEIEHRVVRRNSDEVRHVHERCIHERDAAGTIIQSTGMVQDITERKRAETYREMGQEILQILNEPGDLQESSQRVLAALKARTGVDAVGLRLQAGEDYPYFAEDGFSKDFLKTENTLLERGKDGAVCRDSDGNVCLECTCGLVVSGKTDPSNPLFTQGGSCWTNDSFPLLDLPSDQDPRMHPRNSCIHQGYASVALVPVRISDRIVGLIQLNDKRRGRFTLEAVEMLEGIAAHIGAALMRKRSEEAIRKSEQEKSLILDNATEVIALHNKDRRLIWANRAYLEGVASIVGSPVTIDDLKGKKCHEAWGLTSDCTNCPVSLALESGRPEEGELTPENQEHWPATQGSWMVRAAPVRDASGALVGVIEISNDITERKAAEAAREKLQAQLNQAQKMESVGRLAGGVAHDFNNMLGIIIGHADMLLEKMDPDQPLYADLMEIRKAGARSADLTRQLLAFARQQTVAPKVIDINKTVEGMLKMLRRLIGEDIDLTWRPGKEVWPVKMDPAQIDQILANLCVNARDAIAGVGRITVETRNATLGEEYCARQAGFIPGEYVTLTVNDDGCGMDSATLLLLFEPFFTTKEVGKGTGLGLATVYGIVKQNNGFINVYSEPGQGATFNIYLPRQAADKAPLPERAPVQTVSCGHETILLVEDEPAMLRLTAIMLERQGYTVLAASCPAEAIRLAREHADRIDLLITDVIMPEMNGLDLAKNLLCICPSLKRLFMSGYTADVITYHGGLDEGEHFIQKPFSLKNLGAKVREAMGNGQWGTSNEE